ncbi:unnamed protein product [Meloidogyne enterolobii]|uniref:Uncharacterized protein n=1 Tax=Meloidogyne enterolobii TaxID=390850 RepID=A0ACB1AVZ1_MELEN
MVIGETCEDLIKNWVILIGLWLHLMDYMAIQVAQSTTTNTCLIIEEKWRELMPKRGTLIETNIFEKYKKMESNIEENGENIKLDKFINLVNSTSPKQVGNLEGEKTQILMLNYSEHLSGQKVFP